MAERIIQLAKNLEQLSPKALAQAFAIGGYGSEKLDGVWVAAVCVDGKIDFLSSTLEKYISLNKTHLEDSIRELHVRGWINFVLIGEAYKEGVEQAVISGMCRKQVEGYADTVELHVHELLTLDEWVAGKSTQNYVTRKNMLETILSDDLCTASLKRMAQVRIESAGQLKAYARAVQANAGEGVCYRPDYAEWESGDRSTNLIRIKELITMELEAIGVSGVEAGNKGGLKGVLQVKWRKFGKADGEEGVQDIRGMSHDLLRAWHEDPSLIAGKIVEVHAMKYTAYGMLREPRFKGVRDDKQVADL